MNARGAMEIIIALLALRYHIINEIIFVALIGDAIATSLVSGPIIKKILSLKAPTKFYNYLDSHAFIYILENIDKFTLIEKISEIIAKHNNLDSEIVKSAVIAREEVMPTGLEHGVAIPHARPEEGALDVGVAAVKLCKPINFGNQDNDPVYLVLAFCTPNANAHIELLSKIAEILSQEDLLEKIKKIETPQQLIDLFDLPDHFDYST